MFEELTPEQRDARETLLREIMIKATLMDRHGTLMYFKPNLRGYGYTDFYNVEGSFMLKDSLYGERKTVKYEECHEDLLNQIHDEMEKNLRGVFQRIIEHEKAARERQEIDLRITSELRVIRNGWRG